MSPDISHDPAHRHGGRRAAPGQREHRAPGDAHDRLSRRRGGHARWLGADRDADRTSATARAAEIADREPVSVQPDADLPEVARTMTDYNLVMLPVVDEHDKAIGVVTVDDVLELTLPTGWRRRYGLVRD